MVLTADCKRSRKGDGGGKNDKKYDKVVSTDVQQIKGFWQDYKLIMIPLELFSSAGIFLSEITNNEFYCFCGAWELL